MAGANKESDMGGGLKSGEGRKLKAEMHQKPRPMATDAEWDEFVLKSAREKLDALHEHDAYYEGIRRRWQEESGLGAASAAAWLRQLSLWDGDANAEVTGMPRA